MSEPHFFTLSEYSSTYDNIAAPTHPRQVNKNASLEISWFNENDSIRHFNLYSLKVVNFREINPHYKAETVWLPS